MHCRFLLAACLAMASAACVRYAAAPLDPAANAARLGGEQLGAGTWTLRALEKEAGQRNPAVRVAGAQYLTAMMAIHTSGERPNPTVALSPQIVTPFSQLIAGTYSIDLDWTFETAGKRGARGQVARANASAAGAHLIEAIWKARVAARKAFLELYAAQERARLTGEAIARQEEVLHMLDKRIAAGEEARGATALPRMFQSQLRLTESDATRAMVLARVNLAEALGVARLDGARFSFAAFESEARPYKNARSDALRYRGDVGRRAL